MLWGLRELKHRISTTGSVQISKAELFLLCDDVDGTIAVLSGDVSDTVREALKAEELVAYFFVSDWYVAKI